MSLKQRISIIAQRMSGHSDLGDLRKFSQLSHEAAYRRRFASEALTRLNEQSAALREKLTRIQAQEAAAQAAAAQVQAAATAQAQAEAAAQAQAAAEAAAIAQAQAEAVAIAQAQAAAKAAARLAQNRAERLRSSARGKALPIRFAPMGRPARHKRKSLRQQERFRLRKVSRSRCRQRYGHP
ncbi:hypothetical protein [Pseudomonas capeferrum]|uniref:hypothetical protein n=1 Tax=Pseudomonas capeferrum TaxID=1495066 RepID=UPI0035C12AE0